MDTRLRDVRGDEDEFRAVLVGEDPETVEHFLAFVEGVAGTHRGDLANILQWGDDAIREYYREFCGYIRRLGLAETFQRMQSGEQLSADTMEEDDASEDGDWRDSLGSLDESRREHPEGDEDDDPYGLFH